MLSDRFEDPFTWCAFWMVATILFGRKFNNWYIRLSCAAVAAIPAAPLAYWFFHSFLAAFVIAFVFFAFVLLATDRNMPFNVS